MIALVHYRVPPGGKCQTVLSSWFLWET